MYIVPCFPSADPASFWALVDAGIPMERDDDYLRELLLEFEGSDTWEHVSVLAIGDRSERLKRHYHVLLLVDGGLMAPLDEKARTFRITNQGHDFLAATRQNEAWEATKNASRHIGGASVQMLARIAEGYARQKLAELGVPLA